MQGSSEPDPASLPALSFGPPELGCHCANLAQAVGVVLIGRKGQDKIKA